MIREKLSPSNKYYLPDHRRLELKHFCLQYPAWKKELEDLRHASITPQIRYERRRGNAHSDPVAELAIRKAELKDNINIVEKTALEADDYLFNYILLSVCYGHSFENLKARLEIPCGSDMWGDRIHKFYWLLDKRDKHILIN